MNFRKSIVNNHILGVGLSEAEANITEQEYNLISDRLANKPTAPEGKMAVLADDTYEWEFVDIPQDEPSDEATEADYINALHKLGVQTDEEE